MTRLKSFFVCFLKQSTCEAFKYACCQMTKMIKDGLLLFILGCIAIAPTNVASLMWWQLLTMLHRASPPSSNNHHTETFLKLANTDTHTQPLCSHEELNSLDCSRKLPGYKAIMLHPFCHTSTPSLLRRSLRYPNLSSSSPSFSLCLLHKAERILK